MFVTSSIPRQQSVVKPGAAANAAVLFGSPNKKKKADRTQPTETSASRDVPKTDAVSKTEDVTGSGDALERSSAQQESADTFEWEQVPEDKERWNLEEVEKPDAKELAQDAKDRERAEYEAIGRRLALPGQAISSVENQAKLMSRKLVGQTSDLVTNIRNSICQTRLARSASLLRLLRTGKSRLSIPKKRLTRLSYRLSRRTRSRVAQTGAIDTLKSVLF